jgi:2-polyprenyl-3-methyl-5-hydroxy-6-metoxy-1,4-benzoquinol methylase
MASDGDLDPGRVRQFSGEVLSMIVGGLLSFMLDIGYRAGLFEAAARLGSMTSAELADAARLEERYVREWLAAMATGGVFEYDASARRFALPPEHAACLAGATAQNLAPRSQVVALLGRQVGAITEAFRHGGGVAYEAYQPEFTAAMDDLNRRRYDQLLISGYIGAVEGLSQQLTDGARVLDIGCGTGHCINLMAAAFPASSFTGYDISEPGIAAAWAEARTMGLDNVRFQVHDVTHLPAGEEYDLITAFDAVHDQVDPDAVLRTACAALAPAGLMLVVDVNTASDIGDNLALPLAPYIYSVSVMHCMTVSLAHGGAGLGTAWGHELATTMLQHAGFAEVSILAAPPEDPINCLYVCRAEPAVSVATGEPVASSSAAGSDHRGSVGRTARPRGPATMAGAAPRRRRSDRRYRP